MRCGPIRGVATLEVLPCLHWTPFVIVAHLAACRCRALVILAQLAAILVVATASIFLIHPVLIVDVVALVMLLGVGAKRPQREWRHEEPAHAVLLSIGADCGVASLPRWRRTLQLICAIQYGRNPFVPARGTHRLCARRKPAWVNFRRSLRGATRATDHLGGA